MKKGHDKFIGLWSSHAVLSCLSVYLQLTRAKFCACVMSASLSSLRDIERISTQIPFTLGIRKSMHDNMFDR